jgi:tetratricopeptide (TPR) repeat protein
MKKQLIPIMSFAVCILLTAQANADKIFFTDGTSKPAQSIRFEATTGQYVVDTDKITMSFDKAKVARVEVAKPASYDKAVQLFNSGNFNEAIPLFQSIVSGYLMLGWDNKARDYMGQAYMKKKDYKNAVTVYNALFAAALPSEITPATLKRYQDALLATGEYDKLKKMIDDTIATGSRDNAAMAQITRGDISKKQGKTFDALMDYLRTVILFKNVEEAQPEALYKAAQCLEELRDPRADIFKKKLAQDYPQSTWAAQLK